MNFIRLVVTSGDLVSWRSHFVLDGLRWSIRFLAITAAIVAAIVGALLLLLVLRLLVLLLWPRFLLVLFLWSWRAVLLFGRRLVVDFGVVGEVAGVHSLLTVLSAAFRAGVRLLWRLVGLLRSRSWCAVAALSGVSATATATASVRSLATASSVRCA